MFFYYKFNSTNRFNEKEKINGTTIWNGCVNGYVC